MNKTLKDLRIKSMRLYLDYRSGLCTLEEYKRGIKALDKKIDNLELRVLKHYLQGSPVSERSSLRHLH